MVRSINRAPERGGRQHPRDQPRNNSPFRPVPGLISHSQRSQRSRAGLHILRPYGLIEDPAIRDFERGKRSKNREGSSGQNRVKLKKANHMRMWRNWQTRMVQVHVPARVWRFKSSHPHHDSNCVLGVAEP